MSTNRFDHFSLVMADAERSLEGLRHSLQGGSDDMMQGALHCRDLSAALSILGLDTAASLIDDVARQMTLGQPSVIDVALDTVFEQWSEKFDTDNGQRI